MNMINITRSLTASLLLFAAAAASATSMVPVNLAQIVELTHVGFVGKIESVEVIITAEGGGEKVTATVSEPVLGKVGTGDKISWVQFRQSESVRLPGMPKYAVGEEHLVFLLNKAPGSQYQSAAGLGQGSFRIHRDKSTGQAYARNGFMNQSLFSNLDVDAVATAVVDSNTASKALDATGRTASIAKTKSAMLARNAGSSNLGNLVGTAKALKSQGGSKPSQKFAGSGPKHDLKAAPVISAR